MTKCSQSDCAKRLKLTDFNCKCGNKYCSLHRLPESHKCTFNFKLNQTKMRKLEDEMKCVNQKMIKI